MHVLRKNQEAQDKKKTISQSALRADIKQYQPDALVRRKSHLTDIELLTVCNRDPNMIDLAKVNFLGMLDDVSIKKSAEGYIKGYGLRDSEGKKNSRKYKSLPPLLHFADPLDIHAELEIQLARFIGVEEAMVYAYGFTTISSAIAAYCNQGDLIFCDENVNFAIKQGMKASKSKVVYFSHNDYVDLELQASKPENNEQQRSFLILEGIYFKTGKVCPLPQFLEVAEQYRMRIFLDENISLGVLGATGRGITEHWNISPCRVDMILGTLEGALGSVGGFCAGSKAVIEHQRLSSTGYNYSATLPTYLCQAALASLQKINGLPVQLEKLCISVHDRLTALENCEVVSDPISPVKVFKIGPLAIARDNNKRVCEICEKRNVYMIYRGDVIMVNLNVNLLSSEKLETALMVIEEAAKECAI